MFPGLFVVIDCLIGIVFVQIFLGFGHLLMRFSISFNALSHSLLAFASPQFAAVAVSSASLIATCASTIFIGIVNQRNECASSIRMQRIDFHQFLTAFFSSSKTFLPFFDQVTVIARVCSPGCHRSIRWPFDAIIGLVVAGWVESGRVIANLLLRTRRGSQASPMPVSVTIFLTGVGRRRGQLSQRSPTPSSSASS